MFHVEQVQWRQMRSVGKCEVSCRDQLCPEWRLLAKPVLALDITTPKQVSKHPMRNLALMAWIVREWRRSAPAWALWLFATAIGPICLLGFPEGISNRWAANGIQFDSIWYLSSYCGVLAGIWLAARGEALWAELGRTRMAGLAFAGLAGLGLLHGVAAIGALRLLGAGPWLGGLPALLCVGHWAALGVFVQCTGLNFGPKWILLSALGWWIPALLAAAPEWDLLRWLLGPARHLETLIQPTETSVRVLVDTIPIGAWWIAAALLPTRSAFRK